MHQGKYVFSQIMEQVVRYQFNQCVARYNGEYWMKNLSCWDQFLALSFGQLSFRNSVRDIVTCLNAHREKMYHVGFRSPVKRSTLANANERRDWRIYADFATVLIQQTRKLYMNDASFNLDLDGTAYVLDSTTIELCLNIFPWARLVKKRAAVKVNVMMDLQGNIPAFFTISSGKTHDIYFLDVITYECGAYYIMDRGYIDFERFRAIHTAGAFFVTRAKDNLSFHRLYSNPVDKSAGVRCDQIIILSGYNTQKAYPEKLRRVKYVDALTQQQYVFLTNHMQLDALTIATLYKYRWQIELFFKWIKQHLSITTFWGRSHNAVKTQICIALCVYLLVAILKKKLKIERNSYEILQILSVSLFDKMPVYQLISEYPLQNSQPTIEKQAKLWDD